MYFSSPKSCIANSLHKSVTFHNPEEFPDCHVTSLNGACNPAGNGKVHPIIFYGLKGWWKGATVIER